MAFMVPSPTGVTCPSRGTFEASVPMCEEAAMEDVEGMEELDKRASHHHEATEHGHKHFHVTHYLHRGENWGHLLATHVHEHNHPEVEHVHIPHDDVEKEHRREAHVHDHAHPTGSPA
jgi:hypothetical protein